MPLCASRRSCSVECERLCTALAAAAGLQNTLAFGDCVCVWTESSDDRGCFMRSNEAVRS